MTDSDTQPTQTIYAVLRAAFKRSRTSVDTKVWTAIGWINKRSELGQIMPFAADGSGGYVGYAAIGTPHIHFTSDVADELKKAGVPADLIKRQEGHFMIATEDMSKLIGDDSVARMERFLNPIQSIVSR